MSEAAVTKIESSQRVNKRTVRALVIKADPANIAKATGSGTTAAIVNPWDGHEGRDGLLIPPLDPVGLASLTELSSVLRQCIEAMEINIPGFGWRLRQFKDTVGEESIKAEVEEERARFEEFLRYADNNDQSFVKLRRNRRHSRELIGYDWLEVLRDSTGEICGLNLLPSHTVRMTPRDPEPVEVIQNRIVGQGVKRSIKPVKKFKNFRRFAQSRLLNNSPSHRTKTDSKTNDEARIVWFKEYGDPRDMDLHTGKFVGEDDGPESSEWLRAEKRLATEIIHSGIYSTRDPYGIPRYIGNLLALMGARSAEEINFTTFRNNNIPSMAILVSGGIVTDETVDRMTEFVEESIQGSDNYSKFLVVEAIPDEEDGEASAVRLDMKPLTAEQHTDQLFQNYDGNSREKVRESFRLPPIFIGRSEDYTRATAETSRKIGDEQIFAPERAEEDHQINRLLADMGMKYHWFMTNTPNVTNDQDIIAIIAAAEKAGGMTPRVAHIMLEDIMGQELPVPENIDLDTPFSLQMAEAVKNQADPTEPGQQVTAMKASYFLERINEDPDAAWNELLLGAYLRKRDREEEWSMNIGSQAGDIAKGSQKAALFDMAFGVEGAEYIVSDGDDAFGRVRFGRVERVSITQAAEDAGLAEDDVRAMFPANEELWRAEIETREDFGEPTPMRHDGKLFRRV